MTDHNMLSIEELIAVIQSLPRTLAGHMGTCEVVVGLDHLISGLQSLREIRIKEAPSSEALVHALTTGDCSGLERKAS